MKKILLIEDDFSLMETVCLYLEAKGHDVKTASTGEAAVDMVRQEKNSFDVILCDINLPDILGYDVYKITRTIGYNVSKFIFLTAYADKVFIDDATRLGVDGYMTKPFIFDDLLALIDKHTI